MGRGLLTDEELEEIQRALPDIHSVWLLVYHLSPDFVSSAWGFGPAARIPEATVPLQEAVHAALEARHAAHEALAHRHWYEKKRSPARPMEAVFFGRFYLDDVSLRLYAAGEHLAAAIVPMLELDPSALKGQRERVSKQAALFKYLSRAHSGHVITAALRGLGPCWKWTMDYRGKWVHGQPPLIAGQGIVYRRGSRWTGTTLHIGTGDEPELTIDELQVTVMDALLRFTACLRAVVDFYREMLTKAGFRFDADTTALLIGHRDAEAPDDSVG